MNGVGVWCLVLGPLVRVTLFWIKYVLCLCFRFRFFGLKIADFLTFPYPTRVKYWAKIQGTSKSRNLILI
jgi:hypothetical protein